ncbi:hypothetical protein MD484_g208, partial [Candolleomyces efflorescens]
MALTPSENPRVLLTNDDGPPDLRESPYILGLYRYLTGVLGTSTALSLIHSD